MALWHPLGAVQAPNPPVPAAGAGTPARRAAEETELQLATGDRPLGVMDRALLEAPSGLAPVAALTWELGELPEA